MKLTEPEELALKGEDIPAYLMDASMILKLSKEGITILKRSDELKPRTIKYMERCDVGAYYLFYSQRSANNDVWEGKVVEIILEENMPLAFVHYDQATDPITCLSLKPKASCDEVFATSHYSVPPVEYKPDEVVKPPETIKKIPKPAKKEETPKTPPAPPLPKAPPPPPPVAKVPPPPPPKKAEPEEPPVPFPEVEEKKPEPAPADKPKPKGPPAFDVSKLKVPPKK